MSNDRILPQAFYLPADPVFIAQALLGQHLVTQIGGFRTVGRITETEAYWAPEDRASHAYGNRRTARTEYMFAQGGIAYVYLIYGIHELFNVVTGPAEVPHAVLIRAIEPLEGSAQMLERRGHQKVTPQLSAGPGVLSKALGINRTHNGSVLTTAKTVWLETGQQVIPSDDIGVSPRVGIDGSGPYWSQRPWRFYLKTSRFVSKHPRQPTSSDT